MLLQLAHHVGERMKSEGYEDARVYIYASCSLNGRPKKFLIDPRVDLTGIERSLAHADWITSPDGALNKSLDAPAVAKDGR